jgi:hypothetical protein
LIVSEKYWGGRRGLNPWICVPLIPTEGSKVGRASLLVLVNTHSESLTAYSLPQKMPKDFN